MRWIPLWLLIWGGDDFVSKPFSLTILDAKIAAFLRRAQQFTSDDISLDQFKLHFDGTFSNGNEAVTLSPTEHKILTILMTRHQEIVSKEEILERLWENDNFIDHNTLNVNMTRLRKKIATIGFDRIHTIRGVGYLVKMIRAFLKEYRFFYSQYIILLGLYWLVFYLYHLQMKYFLTANLIALTILGLNSLWKYYQFREKIKILQEFIYVNELDTLSLPSDKAYRSLILKLKEAEAAQLLQQIKQQKNIESLIKMWSHQMKLPLSALSLMVQTQSTDVKEYQQQVFRLEKYLNNLLSYLKFKQHHDDFRFQIVSVREIISSIVKESRYLCIAKELSVTIQGNCQLKTDKKWLRFALMQLIDNAIKYSTKGGNITITLNRKNIIISDNGIGILSEDLPRLFDEGFTGFNGHEHQKATGLGLYMTKEILDQLNLDIKVSSLIGEGTQVIISPLTR